MKPLICLLLCGLALRIAAASRQGAYAPAQGKYKVAVIETFILHDAARKKNLPIKIYFPATGDRFPVIIFSHGFGGSKDYYEGLGRYWARHGYVSIHPSHADSLTITPLLHQLLHLRKSYSEGVKNRVMDIALILDSLPKMETGIPALKGKLDLQRIGIGGHSAGALTAMLLGGVTIDLKDKVESFRDPRIRSVLILSGQGTGRTGLTSESWNHFIIPAMIMTGSKDRGARGEGPEWKMEPFVFSPPGNKYLIFIKGANHLTFTGPFPKSKTFTERIVRKLSARTQNPTLFLEVQECSQAFWDAYLKEDQKARNYLGSGKLQQNSGGLIQFYRK